MSEQPVTTGVGGNVPTVSCNTAALREALEWGIHKMTDAMCDPRMGDDALYLVGCMKVVIGRMKSALSAPPRNCDRFGVREEAWAAFRREYKGDYEVLELRNMFDEWLFAPAKEGGAK